MIRIAIVDDDEYSIKMCSDCIHSMHLNNLDIIDCFENGEKFLDEVILKKVQYDMVILDIDMPHMSGFDVAEKLNEFDSNIIVMFYTAHEQYVFKAFEYQPFRYIRKEFTYEELPFALKCAFEILKEKTFEYLSLYSNGEFFRIPQSSIIYIEADKHYCNIFTNKDECIKMRISISKILQLLNEKSFSLVNKGSIVNIRYIDKITNEDLILNNNKVIQVSRRNYKSIKKLIISYWGETL